MDLSTDEEEITIIMVLSKESEVEVQETLSVIEEVLAEKFRVLNIDDPILIERRFYQSDMSAATSSRRKTVKLPILPMASQSIRAN